MSIGIYPGSFDPVTNGHIDIINRAMKLVHKLVIAVLINDNKKSLLSVEERVQLIKESLSDNEYYMNGQIEVLSYKGLLVELVKEQSATVVIRGVRNQIDAEYEINMAMVNRRLNDDFETICMITDKEYIDISSSTVKEIARFGGDISQFVPHIVDETIKSKF